MKSLLKTSLIFLLLTSPNAFAADNMKAFPPAGEGMARYVLKLDQKEDEMLYRVELIVGKTVLLDAVNNYFLAGAIESEVIAGWGFTRYIVKELGPVTGTLMAVPPEAKKVERFIKLGGDPYLIRYNSRLPIVVYVPEGVEVRYRLWSTEKESESVSKG
jgi:ecotin